MTPPLTPMEDGGTWATLAEGDAFLEAVASDSGNVTILDIGPCSDGNPLRVCVIAPGGVGDLLEASGALLVVASQHGIEPAPREAALRFIRDLAYTADPDLLNALPVVVIPTANPHGTVNGTRANANGQDCNRHHVDLAAPESRMVAELIAALDPRIAIDAHESSPTTSAGRPVTGELNFLSHKQVAAPTIRAWAAQVYSALESHVSPVTVAPYPLADHEGTMTNALACRGIPNLLVETLMTAADAERVAWHLAVMMFLATYAHEEAAALTTVRDEACAWYAAEGFAAHAPIYLFENGWAEAPVGYTNVEGVPPRTLAALGIRTEQRSPRTADLYVPMDQPCAPLIPWLLDRRAPRPVVTGEPVFADRLAEQPVDLLRESDLHQTVIRAAFPVRRVVTEHGIAWGS